MTVGRSLTKFTALETAEEHRSTLRSNQFFFSNRTKTDAFHQILCIEIALDVRTVLLVLSEIIP